MNGIILFILICAICAFWIIAFARAFFNSIVASRKDDARSHRGHIVTGTVISSARRGSGKMQRMTVIIEFPNLSNSKVQETFIFRDSKPTEMRFEEGKNVQLLIDEKIKKGPVITMTGVKKKGTNRTILFFFLMTCACAYGSYVLLQIVKNHIGGNWNNVKQIKTQDELAIVAGVFMFSLVMIKIVFKAVKLSPGQKGIKLSQKLKLHGYRTTAAITKFEETGTRINNNPMIRFYYEFEDKFGTKHKGVDRMILGLIDLAGINDIKEKEVLYLKDDPSTSRLMEAIKGNALGGCSKLILLFIAMIYTIIVVSMFIVGMVES